MSQTSIVDHSHYLKYCKDIVNYSNIQDENYIIRIRFYYIVIYFTDLD